MNKYFKFCSFFLAFLAFLAHGLVANGAEGVNDAQSIVARVNAVEESGQSEKLLTMTLLDSRGQSRTRTAILFEKEYDDSRKTVLFYLEPANVKDTAFLIWDYHDRSNDDMQWLYLPALRKSRRISSADRGDYFLGTNFTYEDIKLDGKLDEEDYEFSWVGEEDLEGKSYIKITAMPRSEELAAELGYSRIDIWVNSSTWIVERSEFLDIKQQPLKRLEVTAVEQVDGYWVRTELSMINHQSGHTTKFLFTEIDFSSEVSDQLFTRSALKRGI